MRTALKAMGPGASDEVLVEGIRRGDEAAVAQMVERYRDRLVSYCARILRSRDEAEDAVQQTMISAIEALKRSDDAISLRPWLYRIAHNNSISALRKRAPIPPADIDDLELPAAAEVSADVGTREELREMLRSIERLPDEQRSALVLSELEDMSGKQVGEALGCEPQRVRNLIYQARQSILADREAADLECREVRRTLASWSGRPDRVLGRHLELCDGCRGYRQRVRRQRAALALVLPLPPSRAFAARLSAAIGVPRPASSRFSFAGSRGVATVAVAVLALVVVFSGRLDDGSVTEPADLARAEQPAPPDLKDGRDRSGGAATDELLDGDSVALGSGSSSSGSSQKSPGGGPDKPGPSPSPAPSPSPPAPAPPPTSPSEPPPPAPPPDPPCVPPSCIP